MNTANLFSSLVFFSTVAYGIRRDHPAIASARATLRSAVESALKVPALGREMKDVADSALDSAAAAGDTAAVRDLLALGAGDAESEYARPIIFAYREAKRKGHADTVQALVASGLVPSWA